MEAGTWGTGSQIYAVGAFGEAVSRFVEADMAVVSKAQELKIDTAHGTDDSIIVAAGFLAVFQCAVRHMGVLQRNVNFGE